MDHELRDGGALWQVLLDLGARYPTLEFAHEFVGDGAGLADDEELCTAGFVARRRAEFAAGRRAARTALARYGRGSCSVVANAHGVPVFPSGYCGSITHKGEHAVVVVGSTTDVAAIGIDLEFDMEHEESVLLSRVATEREVAASAALAAAGVKSPATLILCAKESLFKALNPQDGVSRDFRDVELELALDGSFAVATLVDPQHLARRIVGTYLRHGGLLVSLTIVEV